MTTLKVVCDVCCRVLPVLVPASRFQIYRPTTIDETIRRFETKVRTRGSVQIAAVISRRDPVLGVRFRVQSWLMF